MKKKIIGQSLQGVNLSVEMNEDYELDFDGANVIFRDSENTPGPYVFIINTMQVPFVVVEDVDAKKVEVPQQQPGPLVPPAIFDPNKR